MCCTCVQPRPACHWLPTPPIFPSTVSSCNIVPGSALASCSGDCTSAAGMAYTGAAPMQELAADLPGDCCDMCHKTPLCAAWNHQRALAAPYKGTCQLYFTSQLGQPTRKLTFVFPVVNLRTIDYLPATPSQGTAGIVQNPLPATSESGCVMSGC